MRSGEFRLKRGYIQTYAPLPFKQNFPAMHTDLVTGKALTSSALLKFNSFPIKSWIKKGIHENMKKLLFGITSLTIRRSRESIG